jgi:pyruvate/2-oxoglutarate dehydrogenase complex dihydrolipoamide acyltransferase (E2) component
MEEIFIPALGMAMDDAYLEVWLKQPGDQVNPGDVIALIETDKAQVEIVCETAGTVGRHRYETGSTIPVGEVITVVLAPGQSE